jgi:competence protein ComEC
METISTQTGAALTDDLPGDRALQRFQAFIVSECRRQKPYLFLWSPVFLSFGIGFYFSLPQEPPLIFGLAGVAAALAAFILSSRRSLFLLALLVATGFFAGQIRTAHVDAPLLRKETGPVNVTATIAAIEDLGDGTGSRLILSAPLIKDFAAEETPRRLRLKIRDDEGLVVGQRISALAQLNPPSPPVMPGAFDFRRHLYFQGIGAVGFIYRLEGIENGGAGAQNASVVEKFRQRVAVSFEQGMSYPEAGVAMALAVGRKTAIHKDDTQAMRDSGLAHMLAISGLHVGLFSGVIFFICRFLMVLVPGVALRHPVKKYAAVLAIFGALLYTLLAGAPVPTQRALLMTSIVFLAIILDRSPLSLRLVAFAAFCVLLFFPESLLSPSFQMSFSAVAALVVFYDRLRPHWSAWYSGAGPLRRAALYFAGVALTTIVASTATAPFGLFHFNRFALYSLPANAIAVPVMAFIIMPSMVFALLLLPFGLAAWPLVLMKWGIGAVLDVAHWAAALPHAVVMAPAWPLAALTGLTLAALILALGQGALRGLALVPLVFSLSAIFIFKQPDILISSKTELILLRDAEGTLFVSNRRKDRFTQENWAAAYGHLPEDLQLWPRESREGPVLCDAMACRIRLKGYEAAYLKTPRVAEESCVAMDIVLAPFPLRRCGAPVAIDVFDARYEGTHALWLGPGGITVKTVRENVGARPWSGF